MADQTSSSIVIAAPPAAVMEAIADFEAYPEWAQGVHTAEVRETLPDGRAKEVYFEIEATPIKDSYTLGYDWHGDESVTWSLVSGKMMKKLDGAYVLRPTGSGTEVTYRLAVEVGIPMIGMLKRKAEKVIVDTALKGLKKRVESQVG
ncbi:SRPBCC family protein [Nocardioides caldifontis]|uniref:SRPBCC family protein n=1 Tax=Nocardioides caldifontis TaxID=2588938 RepID=UPI0011DFAE18|nr:SRPBCC family protein [Nocardioides caldifontis]